MSASINVLIVDDDIHLRHILVLQMGRFDLKVDSVASGIEALRQVEKYRYKLIFMDIQMPEMDGLEAAGAIRSYERAEALEPVPIVGMTAGGATRQQCIDVGMNDYLPKPISMESLEEIVLRWLPVISETSS